MASVELRWPLTLLFDDETGGCLSTQDFFAVGSTTNNGMDERSELGKTQRKRKDGRGQLVPTSSPWRID